MTARSGSTGGKGPDTKRQTMSPRYVSVISAVLVAVVVTGISLAVSPDLAISLGACGFFATYIGSILGRLPRLTKEHLRAHADESDLPGYFILALARAALIASATSLLLVVNEAGAPERMHLALGILAVVLGWLGIHTMMGFHYAYEFYETDETSPVGHDGRRGHFAGLDFPGSEMPDGLSFLYFSFVIAMTAQVSDVTVTSNRMRRVVLLHGILSFLFNTVIVATAVNIIVALGH